MLSICRCHISVTFVALALPSFLPLRSSPPPLPSLPDLSLLSSPFSPLHSPFSPSLLLFILFVFLTHLHLIYNKYFVKSNEKIYVHLLLTVSSMDFKNTSSNEFSKM